MKPTALTILAALLLMAGYVIAQDSTNDAGVGPQLPPVDLLLIEWRDSEGNVAEEARYTVVPTERIERLERKVDALLEQEQMTVPDGEPLNLNTASIKQMTDAELPGVGKNLAVRIVDYRKQHGPYEQLSDLLEVPYLPDDTVAGLDGLVVFEETEQQ